MAVLFDMYYEDYEQAEQVARKSVDEYVRASDAGTLDKLNVFSKFGC